MIKSERREQKMMGLGERWRLQDAKARFSEVVKRAREHGPQRVTLHGKDAVVIVSAESYDRERERHTGRRLVEALAASPLAKTAPPAKPICAGSTPSWLPAIAASLSRRRVAARCAAPATAAAKRLE